MILIKEYKRLKRLMRVFEGELSPQIIQNFLAKVDEQALALLGVEEEDLARLKDAEPEEQLQIIIPYLENFIQKQMEEKVKERIQLGEKTAQLISRKVIYRSGKVFLPQPELKSLAQLFPSGVISLEYKNTCFVFPLHKLKQILAELEKPVIIWELKTNFLKIFSKESNTRFSAVLFPQEPYIWYDKIKFSVKIPQQTYSLTITDILFKVADSLLGK